MLLFWNSQNQGHFKVILILVVLHTNAYQKCPKCSFDNFHFQNTFKESQHSFKDLTYKTFENFEIHFAGIFFATFHKFYLEY